MKLAPAKFLVSLFLLSLAVTPILAQQRGQDSTSPASSQIVQGSPTVSPTAARNQIRVRSCEAKQTALQTRMGNLNRMATNMLSVFNSIAQRVISFYTNRVVPTGKTVPNYDTLLADAQTKSGAVQTALNKAQGDASNFNCQNANPKADITLFRQDMQAVKTALKNYRTSIRNLIVAVRGAAVKAEASASPSTSLSPTPTATAVPTATP